MPTYEWECPECGQRDERVASIASRNHPMNCGICGSFMKRLISAAMVQPDIKPYMAMAGDKAGKPIGSRKEHREFLKRNRLVEVGDKSIESTKDFRKVHRPRELVSDVKRAIEEVCIPDLEKGGLRERHVRR